MSNALVSESSRTRSRAMLPFCDGHLAFRSHTQGISGWSRSTSTGYLSAPDAQWLYEWWAVRSEDSEYDKPNGERRF
jgi:hypothetical protein